MQVLPVIVHECWRGIVHTKLDLEFAGYVIGQLDREVVVVGHLAGGDHLSPEPDHDIGPNRVKRGLNTVQSKDVTSKNRHATA